jgi:hypothetical protein
MSPYYFVAMDVFQEPNIVELLSLNLGNEALLGDACPNAFVSHVMQDGRMGEIVFMNRKEII